MHDVAIYSSSLSEIRDYLLSFGDGGWAPVLTTWIAELDGIESSALREHVERTMKATGGMGSLGDLSICPENGHSIADDVEQVGQASATLWGKTSDLYLESKRLLERLQASRVTRESK